MARIVSGIPVLDAGGRLPALDRRPRAVKKASRMPQARYPLGLDAGFLRLSPHGDYLTIRDAMEHFLVMGESGSGKTSLGTIILAAYMRLGFSGLICTYKSDEVERIAALAKATGRENSLIVVTPGGRWCANLLDWELTRPGAGAGLVDNAVSLLLEAISNAAPKGYRESKDSIWDESVGRVLRHAMLLIRAAGLRVTMDRLIEITNGIPSLQPATGELVWPPGSLVLECLNRAKAQGADAQTVKTCEIYFTRQLTMPGSTRFVANVLQSWLNMSDAFQSGPVPALLFAEQPSFAPDVSLRGAIVVLAMPVAEFGAVGRAAQLTYKAAFINECLRRQGLPPGHRPCFLMIDEYQFLASALDAKLMQAGRSSWVSAFCLTQNLPNLYAAMEPGRAHDVVASMVGNYGCFILCRNKCRETNTFASETVNRALMYRWNGGTSNTRGEQRGWNVGSSSNASSGPGGASAGGGSSSGRSGGWNASESESTGWREERDFAIPPETFLKLSGGGPPHFRVTTLLVKAGKRFRASGGQPYMGVAWPQQ